jgi:hypothetical protein
VDTERRLQRVPTRLLESAEVKRVGINTCLNANLEATDTIAKAVRAGDCQHVATEFTSRLTRDLVEQELHGTA